MVLSEEEKKIRKKEANKRWRDNNMDKYKLYQKSIKEKNKVYSKNYKQTENGIKTTRIWNWKLRGVKHNDFNELYEYYLNCNNCENCNVELTIDRWGTSTTKCLDHCHITGEFRNVLCQSCNSKRRY